MSRTWCVKDKLDIWCFVADGKKPDENEANVETACGDWIVLPHGTARRKPTCERCLSRTLLRAAGTVATDE